jgi:protocatechuate 3,4-dioxygenase beta subunit
MQEHDNVSSAPGLRRREALVAAGAAGAAGLGILWTNGRGWIDAAGASVDEEAVAAASCTLTKELTEGPYWIENGLTRRDVTEDREGVRLALLLTVEDSGSCKVIKGADVEIWHAAPDGEYSGFDDSSGTRYLRGHQKSDAAGRVRFDTVFPGWYRGRTPHIHLKVHVGGDEVHTGQLFMGEKVTRAVYRTRFYKSRGQADTSHAEDMIYRDGGTRSTLRIRKRSGSRKGYVGRLELGVKT